MKELKAMLEMIIVACILSFVVVPIVLNNPELKTNPLFIIGLTGAVYGTGYGIFWLNKD